MTPLDIFRAGGLVMYPLLLISFAAVAFAVERALAFKQFGSLAPDLIPTILEMIRNNRFNEAIRLAEETPGPVAATAANVLRNRHLPVADIEREAAATGEDYFVRLERFLPALDTFTTLSPLLGLLGTILGMVKVFQQFTAAGSDEGAKAQILAGVGESLYATAFGIAIAVFCFAIYNYFAARQRNISIEAGQATTRLIAQLNESGPRLATDSGSIHRRRGTKFNKGRDLKKTKIEIIPMIDTMFFLLVFFILSSLGIIKLQGQQVELPSVVFGAQQKPAEVTISINAQEEIKVNNYDVSPGQDIGPLLVREIRKQTRTKSNRFAFENTTVVISADKAVANGLVVRCIDQARAQNISKFAIATQPSNGAANPNAVTQ